MEMEQGGLLFIGPVGEDMLGKQKNIHTKSNSVLRMG